jgi:Protein of unknown function (DUF1826)
MHALRPIDSPPAVLVVGDEGELARVREPSVQAAIFAPSQRPPWETDVAAAVESGRYVIERCTFSVERCEALVQALEQRLADQGLPYATRLALIDDLASLGERLAAIAGCRGVMVRLLTEAPTEHCGFHVDTVTPGVPGYGVLKVYNGDGTLYVDPPEVAGMRRFYDYLGRRERLVRDWQRAADAGRVREADEQHAALRALDAALPFIRRPSSVQEVPPGATVAFRSLDIGEHWSDHAPDRAWIHCSPMTGATRLVANFTPLDSLGDRLR